MVLVLVNYNNPALDTYRITFSKEKKRKSETKQTKPHY